MKLEDLNLLHYVLKRPAMFSIHNIELFYVFFTGYLLGRDENILRDYLNNFNDFIINKFSKKHFEEFNYDRIIRLYSNDDAHSIELLKQLISEFEKVYIRPTVPTNESK